MSLQQPAAKCAAMMMHSGMREIFAQIKHSIT